MAKINSPAPFETKAKPAAKPAAAAPKVQSHAFRETVESIVIAFVLAFLFRTFEAEAFVIPTGSMAPTLMGRHKDVACPKCGYEYEVSASEEEPSDDRDRSPSNCVAGSCPICRYVMPMRSDLPPVVAKDSNAKIPYQPSYNGDRILVNKYLYTFSDPKRWDVVVFKYPGDAKMNYIKRLVGLPGETLLIEHGNILIKPPGAPADAPFVIERKPPDKVLSMRQLVHDTEYDPAELDAAGWPLRWHEQPADANKWKLEKSVVGKNVRQTYSVDATGNTTAWLRYEHLLPTFNIWQQVEAAANSDQPGQTPFAGADRSQWRRLIMDANPYNGREDAARLYAGFPDRIVNNANSLEVDLLRQGLHWVGDLMFEADVNVESASGELLLDLVEAGRHFQCTIDLKTGEAKLSAANAPDFAPTAATAVRGPGKYHVAFANFDEQLLLWVNGNLVDFNASTAYDALKIFGDRKNVRPQTSAEDLGDLAPAGIGARDAKLAVTRLQVWRDIYYIADKWDRARLENLVSDFNHPVDRSLLNLSSDPSMWNRFDERNTAEFNLNNDQLFVMGDNSAESSDARLWRSGMRGSHPGGAYLDRRLLIGKALCVYWPHSWNQIPGTPIPFPLFPNFADMRLVR
jgi:signal peptidase I